MKARAVRRLVVGLALSLVPLPRVFGAENPGAKRGRASVSGNRIGYDFGDVRQWYVNGASGLEQGVVLLEPPPGGDPDPGRPIHVDLSIGGSLSPRLIENGTAVGLFTQQGKWILECGDLAASDASGKELPARIELRPDSTRSLLRISIDASDATYPLLVRSTVSSASPREIPAPGEAAPPGP